MTGSRIGLAATVILVAGCVTAGSLTARPGAGSPGPPSPMPTAMPVPSPAASTPCGTRSENFDWAPFTIANLAASGDIFVMGVATGFEPGVFNTADGRPPRGFFERWGGWPNGQENGHIFTPVLIRVDRVLAGDIATDVLRAFIEGGSVGCWTVRQSGAPHVNLGERYVFVLGSHHDADGKIIRGEHRVSFAWLIDPDDVVSPFGGVFNDFEPITLEALAKLVTEAAPTPAP